MHLLLCNLPLSLFSPHSLSLSSFHHSQVGEQLTSSMLALQAEKERLMRSASEKEAELSSLSQAAQLQQSSLQQERAEHQGAGRAAGQAAGEGESGQHSTEQ